MKIIINAPQSFLGTSVREAFNEVEFTLPDGANLEEMVTCFKAILYAQTYHPDTINRAFGEDEDES
jgi:hypothetical protein